jgi:hypothetical protein
VCERQDYWETDLGYRFVDGNMCDGSMPGSVKPKARVPCGFPRPDLVDNGPVSPKQAPSVGLLVGVLVSLLVIAVVGITLYLWRYNDNFYNAVSYASGIDNCFGRGGAVDVAVYDQVLAGAAGSSLLEDDDSKRGGESVQIDLDGDD